MLGAAAIAQQRSTINLLKSDHTTRMLINGVDVYKVYQGTFQQKYSVLTSDSAYVYLKENRFDAFGHVSITQGDTLHIYADTLNYDDNTKIAILTRNVRMVDKDATLTTNNFTYNTATRIGTYVNGGKLVNKGNTLTSMNGYYYAIPRDSYFRYNVKLVSADANIVADTLRYNTGSRIAYFLGPTNILGKKDKDTLYTENGNYNTQTEQAAFGQNNLYKQGSKTLQGDSLFYDRLKGYGRAVKHVTFDDQEQKMTIKGQIGEYYKSDDRAVVTIDPYVIFVTEEKDTTKNKVDTVLKKLPVTDSLKNVKPDSLSKKNVAPAVASKTAKPTSPATPVPARPIPPKVTAKPTTVPPPAPVQLPPNATAAQRQAYMAANAARNAQMAKTQQQAVGLAVQAVKPALPPPPHPLTTTTVSFTPLVIKRPTVGGRIVKDSVPMKRDTMYIGADTLETQIMTFKKLKEVQEKRRIAGIVDTTRKLRRPFVPDKVQPKQLLPMKPALEPQPAYYLHKPLNAVKPAIDTVALAKKIAAAAKRKAAADSILTRRRADSLAKGLIRPPLPDTARIRTLSAHHNVKIFKSDLQAKSDSLFYSSSDSVIRCYVKPMFWTTGTQMSGDTINLQMKNKKMDNMDIYPNAFAVNVEEKDSTYFNQMGGRRMHAFFKDNKMDRLNVDGNAETIYFNRDKNKGNKVTSMQRSLSSGIRVLFKANEVLRLSFTTKPENKDYPMNKLKEEDKILKNFIWKPKDRPASKEDVIHPKKTPPVKAESKKPKAESKSGAKDAAKKPAVTGKPAVKGDDGKTKADAKSTDNKPAAKDSLATKSPAVKDTIKTQTKPAQLKRDTVKADTVKKQQQIIKKS
ncbi:OstA-like protein [Mucilaginibacter yixingensis]|uniref:OstA-like protein n=1 Tax=Mucilaginibacter yixingensis TaxID=1295612 RepID=UPI002481AD81|nr:OstA-like protein [Mucilaginibacter yixingensis]